MASMPASHSDTAFAVAASHLVALSRERRTSSEMARNCQTPSLVTASIRRGYANEIATSGFPHRFLIAGVARRNLRGYDDPHGMRGMPSCPPQPDSRPAAKEMDIEPRKVRALLADDEKHIRQLIKAVLTTLNCEVVGEAENGLEAVLAYEEKRPDVILLDVNMPVKDGLTALREIRSFDSNALVIMLTSLSDLGTIQAALDLGASQYVRKDTPVAELRKLLVEAWRDHVAARKK